MANQDTAILVAVVLIETLQLTIEQQALEIMRLRDEILRLRSLAFSADNRGALGDAITVEAYMRGVGALE